MRPKDHLGNLFRGTVILTIAALVTKILSAIYRIPFQNIVGDIGFYIYQQVYPFYGIAIVLSTYGFPVVISKLYAEEVFRKEQGNVKQLFIVSALFLVGFGLISFLVLYNSSNLLAEYMGDPQLAPLLRVISYFFLIMPFISLFRGFFQGASDMIPTAVSQVSEQLIRVLTILFAAIFLVNHQFSLYQVGVGAVFGSITGGIASVVLLLFFWFRRKGNGFLKGEFRFRGSGKIIHAFLSYAFPICISSMLIIFLQLADSLNLYALLMESGINSLTAKEIKGVYDRGQPLIQLGTVVATSMSLSLVPLITKEKMQKNEGNLKEKIRLALRISIIVGAGATVGLWCIMEPTNIMLFENASGSEVLAILSTIILPTSIIMTLTAILQGLGYIYFPAILTLLCLFLKYGLNTLLVLHFGTIGAAYASVLSLLVILVLFLVKLHKIMGESLLSIRFIMMNGFAVIVMMVVLTIYLHITGFFYEVGIDERIVASIQALTAVTIGGLSYLILIIRSNLLTAEELTLLPFGSKLMLFTKKK